MDHFPRRVEVVVQAVDRQGRQRAARFRVREVTVGDWARCGPAYGRVLDAFLGTSVALAGAGAAGRLYEAAGAIIGDVVACLRQCVEVTPETRADPDAPEGIDGLPLSATHALVHAFLELNVIDPGKAAALAAAIEALTPTMRAQVERIETALREVPGAVAIPGAIPVAIPGGGSTMPSPTSSAADTPSATSSASPFAGSEGSAPPRGGGSAGSGPG